MTVKVLLIAVVIDWLIGEPPNRWHPVVWMGRWIGYWRSHSPKQGNISQFLYGGWLTLLGSCLVYLLGFSILWITNKLPYPLNLLAQGWLLKTTFSLKALDNAALEVEHALREGDIIEARRLLSWHLVSRDVSDLDESHVVAAVIQSVAENTSDGIIAPLVWYTLGGLPLALVYRYVNTGDAMLGYRDVEREWLGKPFARTDDALNLIPARLTALLFLLFRLSAWRIWQRDKHITASPNAGHPMSAMAGVLDVEMEKVNHYTLNAGASSPTVDHIQQSRRLVWLACGIFFIGLSVILRRRND